MGKGNVLVVSYHFYPSPEVGARRPSETAMHLARNGFDVTVLRAWERRFSGRESDPGLALLDIVSVAVPPRIWTALWIRAKGVLRRRRPAPAHGSWAPADGGTLVRPKLTVAGWIRRQILAWDTLFQGNKRWLLWSVLRLLWKLRGKRIDVVIASGPPMVSYICGWVAARLKSAQLILDFRDPWYLHGDPELTTMMLGHPLARFENGLGRRFARDCAKAIAASPGTQDHIVDRLHLIRERTVVIRNGFDAHAVIDAPVPTGRLEFLYAGSLYWNRNPFPFLEALGTFLAGASVDRSRVRCRLIGNCDDWKGLPLKPWIDERGLADVVEILPFVTPAELHSLVAGSNVLINFAQGQKRQIPAKSFDYIASRREVLVITEKDGNVAGLFAEAGVGRVVEPQDTAGFERAIADFYDRFVTSPTPAHIDHDIEPYSRRVQVERFATIVEDVSRATRQS